MSESISTKILQKVRKLTQLPDEVRNARHAVSVTRLTVLKSLCQQQDVANRFVTYLARQTHERLERGESRSRRPTGATDTAHREMMSQALTDMEAWQRKPSEERRRSMSNLLVRMRAEQNEHKNIPFGAMRLITDWELMLFEHALRCHLNPPHEAGTHVYQMARDYAERYDPSCGTGLIPASAPLIQDIADFWRNELAITEENIATPDRDNRSRGKESSAKKTTPSTTGKKQKARFTHRQGQFLAFIHLYRRLHRQGPSEKEIAQYFCVRPSSVHAMLLRLEELGLLTREPVVSRSIQVAIPEDEIPSLDRVEGPAW